MATKSTVAKKISVIVPAYNEESGIGECLKQLGDFFSTQNFNSELIVIDNISNDDTQGVVSKFIKNSNYKNIDIRLERSNSRGKGNAIRKGFKIATGEWVLTVDVDLSMSIDQFSHFVNIINLKDASSLYFASREEPDSMRIGESPLRHLIGKLFNYYSRLLLPLKGIKDTQCGFKFIRNTQLKKVLPALSINGFALDVELIYLFLANNFSVSPIGIKWQNRKESKVGLINGGSAFFEVLKIWWNIRTRRY